MPNRYRWVLKGLFYLTYQKTEQHRGNRIVSEDCSRSPELKIGRQQQSGCVDQLHHLFRVTLAGHYSAREGFFDLL